MPEPHLSRAVDVFIDLSASVLAVSSLKGAVEGWGRADGLGAIARRVSVGLPAKVARDGLPLPEAWRFCDSGMAGEELSAALATAGRDNLPLLILFGAVDLNSEAVGVLRQSLERDPMFGCAVPRTACANRCCFARVTPQGLGATEWLPREILADLPAVALLVEMTAPCMLVSPQLAGNFGPLDARFHDVPAAMVHYLATARRCGFRTVLCNRAVVGIKGLSCDSAMAHPLPAVDASDEVLLRQLVPDLDRSWQDLRGGSLERFERLCVAGIGRSSLAHRRSLLLDVRNVGPIYNGTTQAVLGILNGLKTFEPTWDVAILATADGAAFHSLERAYAGWPVHTAMPDRPFTAAFRPSQPWHIQEMIDLHNASLFNAYLMLDTIAWDIAYATTRQLEGTWQFLADHADAFLFDSEFTRRRFIERFPSAAPKPGRVTHLSFDPAEYRGNGGGTRSSEFILVVGNSLDHKDVRNTVEVLASAFPFRQIKALGPAALASPLVEAQPSGELSEIEIQRLYASAQFVVFPSFYEGFGFPILTALAYGRTVLARHSALVDEVAAQCGGRGRLVVFNRREELVELIGRMVHGETVPEHPLGLGNNRPKTWADVAGDALAFLESCLREGGRSRWMAREHAVRQLMAYRT